MQPDTPGAGGGPSPVHVVSMQWERVQLVIGIGPADRAVDPGAFRLERGDDAASVMPPTGSRRAGAAPGAIAAVELRFNITLGPRQRPLESGRWGLTTTGGACAAHAGHAAGHAVSVADGLDPAKIARTFRIPRYVYSVTPVVDASGGLALDIALTATGRSSTEDPRAGRRHGRLWTQRRERWYRRAFAIMTLSRRLSRRSGRRVLFLSGAGSHLTGNLEDVRNRMVERGLDRAHEVRTLFHFKPGIRNDLAALWAVARADVILVAGSRQTFLFELDVDPDVRIVQLWHASGAFKTVGYSRVGKPGGPSPYSRAHKNYTHAIVSSEHDVPFYAEAFGIPEERVIPTGIPRMDRYFDDAAAAAGRAAALAAYPEIDGRMTILFAPTYRGSGSVGGTYPMEMIDFPALHALCVERDAIALLRMHPFARRALSIPAAYRDRIIDGSRSPIDVNDLLFAVDLLITDYSSIVFEYSVLGRPMLFYAYDLEEYIESRDFYEPFEAFVPGRIVRTFDELLDAIRREDYEIDKVAAFAARHFAHLDGGSTDRVIDDIILAT